MDRNIKKTRTYIKNKLATKIFDRNEKEFDQIYDLLRKTVENGESNSTLVIGQRGYGKTTFINSILNKLNEDIDVIENAFVVKLHGLVHTDDRLALKGITAQMNLENAVDGKVFGSFAENLAFLLACLKTGHRETSKSVIVIMEEFDLFCTHNNQTLLYNLFDVSQSAQTPLCIIGITCRLDVIELLEKRVKSRFSHRQVFLFSEQEDSDSTPLNICLNKIEYYLTFTNSIKCNVPGSFKKQWNTSIKELINEKKFKTLIQRLIDVNTAERILKNMLTIIVSSLNESKTELTLEDFETQINNLERDEMLNVLLDLSVLEMCLLIAMKHHSHNYDDEPFNFEMIVTRYTKFASSYFNMQNAHRPVLMKAFEHIQNMKLILPVLEDRGKLQKEYRMFRLLLRPQLILEAVNNYPGMPTEVVQWSKCSIT